MLQVMAVHAAPPPQVLRDRLLELAGEVDVSLQRDLSIVLGRMIDNELARRFARLAQDEQEALGRRRIAVLAMGHHRTQGTAALLLSLTRPEYSDAIRRAAFTSLQTLTGLTEFDADREAWADWWNRVRRLSPRQWHEMLVNNLGLRVQRQANDRDALAGRLQAMVREQYRSADAQQRAQLLPQLLNDPLESVRELAMSLSVQRLVDDDTFDEPLREALRDRLADPSPTIRQRAALLFARFGG